MPLKVLYVCTGNICRSPMAALVLRSRAAAGKVEAFSAGVHAVAGEAMDTPSAAALREAGIDPSQHSAHRFEPWMATTADLVLTAEIAHRDQVLSLAPEALRHTFTMREFARLARHRQGGGALKVIAALADERAVDGAIESGADDVLDPYRGTIEQARTTLGIIAATVDTTIDTLGLGANRPRPGPRPRPFSE